MLRILILLLILTPVAGWTSLKVITTTTDLEALVRSVGQDRVDVSAIAKGTQDVHQIEAKPSFMVKMRQADLVISHGLELESAWLSALTAGSRNPKILPGTSGSLELGASLDPLEVRKGPISRKEGDVHPGGNPHFHLDPIRMGQAALLVAERLSILEPSHKIFFNQQAKLFQNRLLEKTKLWADRINKSGIKNIVTYHKTFEYFLNRFSIKSVIQLEPKPGIPPSASHLLEVINEIKKNNIKLVLIENYYDFSVGEKLQQEIPGLKVLSIAVSVRGLPDINTTEELIEKIVTAFETVKK